MRNVSDKLIIYLRFVSLCLLCMPKMSSSATQCCETFYCDATSYGHYSGGVKYPFRVSNHQPESCGCQGFDLYCDDELGLLLQLPNAGNFTIEYIFRYSRKEIHLSDPNECLPQRLLLSDLDLSTTPFRGIIQSLDFQLYNCSGVDFPIDLFFEERIDCLSGFDYTIISERRSITNITNPNCTFLKTVSVPTDYAFSYLSSYSTIDLSWDDHECVSCESAEPPSPPLQSPSTNDSGLAWKVVLGVILLSTPILIILIRYKVLRCCWTQRINNNTGANTPTQTSGLDQITIDSYPTMILRDSSGLRKSDHNMCPICLSEYSPNDTVKILPNCLHRFHVDCIDIWLKTQPTCPICRTSPSENLTNFIL